MSDKPEDGQPAPDLQVFLVQSIQRYTADSPLNRLRDIDGSPIWEEPLIGFADGDDPLFDLFKTVVGGFHLLPRAVLAAHAQDTTGTPPPVFPHVGVVSWILPAAGETRLSNGLMSEGPSLRWNHSRFQGEDFNEELRRHVVSLLEQQGYTAVAPVVSRYFERPRAAHGLASTWSERHVAYAAGHGTFSLSDGLITARGIAHRCGSVVTNLELPVSPRTVEGPYANCLFYVNEKCRACIERCPAGAITEKGHDKVMCGRYLRDIGYNPAQFQKGYDLEKSVAGCGMCQTKVPCEALNPTKKLKK